MGKKKYDENELQRAVGMFGEQINDKLDLVLEAVDQTNKSIKNLATKEELAEVKADVKVIKAAVTDTNKDLHHLERRFSRLKAA